MNLSCLTFILNNIALDEVKGKRIIEVGSQNVNGSVRPAFKLLQPIEYLGVDFQEGNGVDLVCDAADIIEKFGEKSFDIVVSTEMLEHVADWNKIISNLKRLVKDNGFLFLTTRSQGFQYHAYPYDFWRYELEDFREIFSDMDIIKLEKDNEAPGVFLKAMKPIKFSEKDLSKIKLYSIIFDKRHRCLSNEEIHNEDFKRSFRRFKFKLAMRGKVFKKVIPNIFTIMFKGIDELKLD